MLKGWESDAGGLNPKSDAHVCCQISLSTRLHYVYIAICDDFFSKTSIGVQPAAFHFCEEEQYNQRFPREIHPTLDKDDISAFTISAFLSFVDHRKISICQGTWRQLAEVKRNLSIKFYVKVSLLQFFCCFLKDCCCKKRRVFFMGPTQLC